MLKTLLKINFLSLISQLFKSKKKGKLSVGSIIGFSLLGIYIVGIFGVMFTVMFSTLCKPLHLMQLDWFYFSLAGVVATALMFVGSVFATQAQLYDAKDNELLLSLPIPPKNIVGSRTLMLLLINLFFELCVLVPAAIVYGINIGFSPLGFIALIVCLFTLPFFSLFLSFVVGYVIQQISCRMRNKSLVTMILSIGFLLIYFYFYSQINTYLQTIITQGEMLAKTASQIAPIFWFGNSITTGNPLELILFVLLCLIPFVIIYAIISNSFIKITTTKKGFAKKMYIATELRQISPFNALVKKEFSHFISSPMYMLNCGLGVVFIVIGSVFLLFNKGFLTSITSQIPGITSAIPAILIAAICYCDTIIFISAPSVSLEGKNLWISQSIPVDYKHVLLSKAWVHILICLPANIIAAVIVLFVADFTPIMLFTAFVLPNVFTVFCSLFGVAMNMLFPKFDWISETAAIKQSFSSIAAMFGTAGILIVPIIIYFAALLNVVSLEAFALMLILFFALICIVLYRLLVTWGKKKYATL